VVVIGGGIVGCSVAYHLARLGVRDVLLVEKGELTSGTTFHSVGLVTQFRTLPADARLMRYSAQLYQEVCDEIGELSGWRAVGSLRLASSPQTLDGLRRNVSRVRALGLDLDLISGPEAVRLFPAMTGAGLEGAVFIPGDGWVEASSMTRALARRAQALGVEIATDTLVTGITRDARGHVREVVTSRGTVRTECVVNAAGQWANQVAAMVGASLPIIPFEHQYAITKPIPGQELSRTLPVVRDPDNLVYFREEVGGFLIGGFEPDPRPWRIDGVPWDFTQRLLPPDWRRFEPLLEGAIRRCPVLEKAEMIQLVNGPDGMTPDGHYALGPLPGIGGFWVAAGMNLNGIAGAGGVGRIVAEWIAGGEPSIDVFELNVRRFGRHLEDRAHAAEKAGEVYRWYYRRRFPADEDERGRPLRTSALYPRLHALGAVFGEKAGWERALWFEPGKPGRAKGVEERAWGRGDWFEHVGREHRAVRERVGVLDMTSFGKLDVTGPGALAFLQRLACNDVDRPAGSLVYTQFLNARGGIECDVTVTRLAAAAFRVTTGTGSLASDLGWMTLHRPEDGSVSIRDVTAEHAVISVWGPRARALLAAITSADVSDAAFAYLTSRPIDVAGIEVRANRVSFAGELGWELVAPREGAPRVWDAVIEAGAPHGIAPVGYYALDSLRLEKCFYYWGDDIGPGDTPLEANLGFTVRLAKGEFIGREALLRQKAAGVERTMVPLTLDGDACVLYGGEAVVAGGAVAGRVRSGGYGYTIGKNIALASLPVALAAPGTRVAIESFGRLVPGLVERAPLWDPEGRRVRG